MVRLWWLRRDAARRRWVLRMMFAVCSRRRCAVREGSDFDCTTAVQAVRTWQTVNWGFFFPTQQGHPREEQVRHRRQELVPQQADIRAALEVIEAQLRFLIFEAAFHTPPTEGHEQQHFERGLARRESNEVLDLMKYLIC
jgi:hypothetical protein